MFKEVKLTNLEVSTSNHSPLWLEPEVSTLIQSKKIFRFENAWLREPMCYQLVEDVWSNNSFSFYEKLKVCADVLSTWGKEVTGDFKGRIHKSKKKIQALKGRKDDISLKLIHEEKKALTEIYAQQEVFWRQRSKQFWLREGDQNNKYFHAATKNRRKTNHIGTLHERNSNKVTWRSGLEQMVEDYFVNLFSATNIEWESVTDCISSRVTESQNQMLLTEVDEKEVKAALFSMHPDKAPGPDGMTLGFYQKCWKIVKEDVVATVKNFFVTGTIDEQLKNTNIALIDL